MLSFLGRGKGGGESGGVGSASDPSSAAPRPDAPASNLAGADAVEISLQATLEGHTDRVWCVAWEPQGRSLATCSSDKTVRLWAPSRAAGGAWVTVAELEGVHNRTVRSVAWSPCGASVSRLNLTDIPIPSVAAPRPDRTVPRLALTDPSPRPRVPASPRPTPRHREFRRQHRRVGAAGRRVGVRRRGGGPRERGEILRVVPQRPALGHVRPR